MEKYIRRLKDLYHNSELYIKYLNVLIKKFGKEKLNLEEMKIDKQRNSDFEEDILKFVINQQLLDMNEDELNTLYKEIINIKNNR